jgi:hypothetical protein
MGQPSFPKKGETVDASPSPLPASMTPPPPPPPQRSRRGLWIGIAVVILLCLCCVALAAGAYFFRDQIPAVGALFPSPTPPGRLYTNAPAGFSLTYPNTWVYDEEGDATTGYIVFFASSQSILDSTGSTPADGAALIVFTKFLYISYLPSTVDASSPIAVLDYFISDFLGTVTTIEAPHLLTVDSYPAAAGVFRSDDTTSGVPVITPVTIVLHNDEVAILMGICEEASWSQYQAPLQSIVDSVDFLP